MVQLKEYVVFRYCSHTNRYTYVINSDDLVILDNDDDCWLVYYKKDNVITFLKDNKPDFTAYKFLKSVRGKQTLSYHQCVPMEYCRYDENRSKWIWSND